jgi:hypothetical protein
MVSVWMTSMSVIIPLAVPTLGDRYATAWPAGGRECHVLQTGQPPVQQSG